jgi:hypothetical protein
VDVVSTAAVGPYDTAVLTATDSEALVAWLQANDYAVPDALSETLLPYIGGTTHFVALKLQKDRTVGSLEPFALRFDGVQPSIPIQLTAVAAGDDMPIDVFVLGTERAIPSNYLHVRRNPLRRRAMESRAFALQRVSQAVDEAGGHAFETVFADTLSMQLYTGDLSDYDIGGLAESPDLVAWMNALAVNAVWDVTVEDIAAVVPFPDDVEPADVLACPSCFEEELTAIAFDGPAFTDAMVDHWLEPVVAADALLDGGYVTRLRSTMSPSEMTLDPMFEQKAGLPDVSNVHRVHQATRCDLGTGNRATSPIEVVIDGLQVFVPSDQERMGQPVEEWLYNVSDFDALVVEDLTRGDVLVDRRDELTTEWIPSAQAGTSAANVLTEGCACSGTATLRSMAMTTWGMSLLILARRRLA